MNLLRIYSNILFFKQWERLRAFPIESKESTISYIVDNRCSLSRFGDGEFKQILALENNRSKNADIGFQKFDKKLALRLKDVLASNNDNLAIGLPSPMFARNLHKMKRFPRQYWMDQSQLYFEPLRRWTIPGKIYYDSFISRFYMDFKINKSRTKKYISKLKQLWDKRNIIIVEGEKTRLGVGNDLFSNSNSIHRIICPSTNAFSKIDCIEEAIIHHYKSDNLVLVALGPTATVIAADMSKINIQTIDIGHVDIEYEWFNRASKFKEPIPGKFVNEAHLSFEECNNLCVYNSQIVETITLQ